MEVGELKLSQDVLLQLKQVQKAVIGRGDIFFLPPHRVIYGNDAEPHSHPCLVVAVDRARAHLVAGTSGNASGPALVVEIGETDLRKRTEFDFRSTWPLPLTVLVDEGDPMGRLPAERHIDMITAIKTAGNPAVRRLLKLMDS